MTIAPDSSVAAVLTCYNEGPYIGAAIRSVLGQTRSDLIESIVIADDGSAPETLAVLQEIEQWDSRIRIIYGKGGAGLPAQRNLAIRSTLAPYIAILDGDDVWVKNKIETQVPIMQVNTAVGLVYSGYFTFAADDLSDAHRAKVRDITCESDVTRAYFIRDPPIIPSTTLIRRTMFETSGGFDATIRVFEDTDFYVRLSRRCRFAFTSEPLLYKRSRVSSITGGRNDLMAHHAFVALKAAAEDDEMLALVPRRLSERARKLGNHYFLLGRLRQARSLLRLATRLAPTNLRAWLSLGIAVIFPRAAQAVMQSRLKARRAAMGAGDGSR